MTSLYFIFLLFGFYYKLCVCVGVVIYPHEKQRKIIRHFDTCLTRKITLYHCHLYVYIEG